MTMSGAAHAALAAMYADNRVLVFGHRGASAYAPMNTLPAFELAAAQGADGIELDVHRTRDGHIVIVHDFTVDKTTDGSGRVTDMTLAQVRALDAGSWFGEAFRGTRVPTLDEVFEAVGQRLYVNVELKSESSETDGLEQAVADVIARHNVQQRVIVSSFNPLALARFRGLMPDVPAGFLYDATVGEPLSLLRAVGLTVEALHPHQVLLDAGLMVLARTHGWWVNAWTVNDPARAVELRGVGVDMVMTDNPDTVRHALG
jgi:glycerophosphoryl diester phosphodiesterase